MTTAWIIAAVTCAFTALMAYALARAANGLGPDTCTEIDTDRRDS